MAVKGSGFILVLNAGSSSLKFKVFDRSLEPCLSGAVSNIGLGNASMEIDGSGVVGDYSSHKDAIKAVLDGIAQYGYSTSNLLTVGHRVVHGGVILTEPTIITEDVLKNIASCDRLAPLHNPHNRRGIEAVADICPDIVQVACFDTAFHATNSAIATAYALPQNLEQDGKRRFGFHGSSFEAVVRLLPRVSNQPLPERILALHLGNGASVCAIRDGLSVATSMGYSPLEGLTMGTRVGSIDAGLVLELASEIGIEAASELLNKKSGLLGLSGTSSDMAYLLENYESDARSRFAVDHFCYWAARHSASMIGAMQGLDAVVFTGGIGEHAVRIRSQIIEQLSWLNVTIDEHANKNSTTKLHSKESKVDVWIIKAEEEQQIAKHAADLLRLMEAP